MRAQLQSVGRIGANTQVEAGLEDTYKTQDRKGEN